MVHQLRLEPCCSQPPVQLQIMQQEGGHHLTATIAHVTSVQQLAHACVDEGIASQTQTPSSQQLQIRTPLHFMLVTASPAVRIRTILVEDAIPILVRQESEVISEEQLDDQPLRADIL